MNKETALSRYDLTAAEKEALAQATPEQIAEAAAELVREPEFWAELAGSFVEGFLRGLTK